MNVAATMPDVGELVPDDEAGEVMEAAQILLNPDGSSPPGPVLSLIGVADDRPAAAGDPHDLDAAADRAAALAEYDADTLRLINDQERLCQAADGEHEDLKAAASTAKKRAEAEADRLRALIRGRQERRAAAPARSLLDFAKPVPKWRGLPVSELSREMIDAATLGKIKAASITNLGDLSEALGSFEPAAGPPFGLTMVETLAVKSAISDIIEAESSEADRADPATADGPAADPELWRAFPIARWLDLDFGVTAKDVEKLAAGEVKRETGRRPVVTVGDLSDFSTPTPGGYTRGYADVKGIGTAGADRISEAEMRFWKWWGAGGEAEFAAERGVTPNATVPGIGGGVPVADDADGTDADDADTTDTYTASGSEQAAAIAAGW